MSVSTPKLSLSIPGSRREEIVSQPALHSLRARREDIVNRHVAAENASDVNGLIPSFHRPQYDVVPVGSVSDAESAVRELMGGLLHAFPDFHAEPLSIHHADTAVILEVRLTGTHQAVFGGIEPKGNQMNLRLGPHL